MSTPSPSRRLRGPGIILVAVYAVLAIAATGRSAFQILDRFDAAPVAYTLSALAAVVYIVATLALALRWRTVAWLTIGFELVGVLVVGAISLVAPHVLGLTDVDPFGEHGDATVWSVFGAGYVFIPLVLPILGLLYLARDRRRAAAGS